MKNGKNINKFTKGFTLIELLVVVLIIGILASIALPQYRRAVLKAHLHKGIPLVASLYEAEQLYYMINGSYTTDIDSLEIEIPKDASCEKEQTDGYSGYLCNFGKISLANGNTSVSFFDVKNRIAYLYFVVDFPFGVVEGGKFVQGKRYCCSLKSDTIAQSVCESMDSIYIGETSAWKYYELK